MSIVFSASESWTLNAHTETGRRIRAMEMRCYRRLLSISYEEHITNKEPSTTGLVRPDDDDDGGKDDDDDDDDMVVWWFF
ncbi:hypothetical protein ElyMa_005676800 [Elysia marginata]|uniref:Uncharacterized protein n=1 Tax=Elysia marginata TaxID=1093978 RepID=A0AAV4FDD8_9GAST|nr:hypothetical protein ElyMa_005676800 [Elysia marginata]